MKKNQFKMRFKVLTVFAVFSTLLMTACSNSGSNNNNTGTLVGVGTSVNNCVGTNCTYGSGQAFVTATGIDNAQTVLLQLAFEAPSAPQLVQQYGGAAYAYYQGQVAYAGAIQFGTTVCGVNLSGQQIPLQPVSMGSYNIGTFAGGALGANINGVQLVVQIGAGELVNPNGTDSNSAANRFSAPLIITLNGQACSAQPIIVD